MNIHKNARLTPQGREILVRRMLEEGLRVEGMLHKIHARKFPRTVIGGTAMKKRRFR